MREPKMLDYTQAKKLCEGRLDKYLGRRIATGIWLKYDSERDCFVCSQVWSKYKIDAEASAALGYSKYRLVGKDEWGMRPYAEIFPDRVTIILEGADHRLRNDFNLYSYRPTSNATDGTEWHYRRRSGRVVKAIGSLPVTINLVTEEIIPTAPRVRTFNKEKQKELNALIARIRRELKVRYKLGAFNSVPMDELVKSTMEVAGGHLSRYKIMSDPEYLHYILCMVTADDIKSFYPLVCILRWYRGIHSTGSLPDLPKVFEQLINSRKEGIRLMTGVVYYEAADTI